MKIGKSETNRAHALKIRDATMVLHDQVRGPRDRTNSMHDSIREGDGHHPDEQLSIILTRPLLRECSGQSSSCRALLKECSCSGHSPTVRRWERPGGGVECEVKRCRETRARPAGRSSGQVGRRSRSRTTDTDILLLNPPCHAECQFQK